MSFASDIEKFAKKTNRNSEEVCQGLFVNLFSRIIEGTRVDTGRLRGNWQTSVGSPSMTEDNDRLDPTGDRAKGEVETTIDPTKVNYLTNNLPYAKVWEDVDGMVAKNIVRLKRTLKEEIRNVTN